MVDLLSSPPSKNVKFCFRSFKRTAGPIRLEKLTRIYLGLLNVYWQCPPIRLSARWMSHEEAITNNHWRSWIIWINRQKREELKFEFLFNSNTGTAITDQRKSKLESLKRCLMGNKWKKFFANLIPRARDQILDPKRRWKIFFSFNQFRLKIFDFPTVGVLYNVVTGLLPITIR